jgi:hypothetical protein
VNVTPVALANKNARIISAMMMHGASFRRQADANAA